MRSGVVMQKLNSILLLLDFCCNLVQLLTIEVSNDDAASWKKFPMNDPPYSPPKFQHDLLWMKVIFGLWYTCLPSSHPLSLSRIASIQHPLFHGGTADCVFSRFWGFFSDFRISIVFQGFYGFFMNFQGLAIPKICSFPLGTYTMNQNDKKV